LDKKIKIFYGKIGTGRAAAGVPKKRLACQKLAREP
jgi:hypothetical protein